MASVFKSVEPSHISITPFYANKLWEASIPLTNILPKGPPYVGAYNITATSMSVYFGRYTTAQFINPEYEEYTTNGELTRNIWNSVNNLYYKDFTNNPVNYHKQGLDGYETRSIGTTVQVYSIPQQIVGLGIERGSFILTPTGKPPIMDDSYGNLRQNSVYVGNIIYNEGMAILTNNPTSTLPAGTMQFRSTKLITSNEVICVSGPGEHNMTMNPSIIGRESGIDNPGIGPDEPGGYTDNDGICYSFVTGSFFSPYITTVGLYNDAGELLVVGKLSRAVKKATNCDTIFVVRWDS